MRFSRVLSVVLALCIMISFVACGKTEEQVIEEVNEMALRAAELKVNNLVAPLGVDTIPLFHWTPRSKTIGRLQKAYQIIVASTPALAAEHTGDLWDTGKVVSATNFDIAYQGTALAPCSDYYWSVRLWDETDTATDWSKVARFGTGMLEQSDWTAKWIGGSKHSGGNMNLPAPMLRKSFDLDKKIVNANVYICGLGVFELKINGVMADDSVLTPADTQFEDTVSYCVYDVTKLLSKGKNALAVELGNLTYNMPDPISANFVNGVWKDDPKLLLELHIEFDDGTKKVIISDESWKSYEDGPIRRNSLYCGEIYEASKEVKGWTDADFDDSGWNTARLAAAPAGKLKFENMEPMRRVKTVTPTVRNEGNGTWLVLPGEYCTGWAKIAFDTKRGEQIKIRYLERETDRAKGLHTTVSGADTSLELQVYTYRAKGVPGEVYEPKFSYCGYEVIEITGYSGELKPEDVECYVIATDYEHIGSFESGNELVNKLHEVMVRTMICNSQGKPTDTPVYEKLGFTGDYNAALKTFNYNFDTTNFFAHFAHNLRDTGLETGQVNEYSPSGQIATWYDAPCWTQVYVNGIYAAWHENGQFSLVEEHYDYMRTQVEYWIAKIQTGTEPWIWQATGVNNRLGDWAAPYGSISPTTAPPEGGSLYNTAAVHRVLLEFAEISTAMGATEDAQRYLEAADKIYEAFNRVFYNKEKGIYETDFWNGSTSRTRYRQSCNLVPLYYGLCPDEWYDTVLNNLLDDIETKDYHSDVGHIGAEIILPLLSREGKGDIAMKILMQTDYPSWGYWLSKGTTTAWEGWAETARSKCHYFLGTYDEWFYQNLAGIQNPRNGYETVTIRPEIYKELRYISASVDTVRGELASGWQVNEDNTVTVTVTVPVGTTADILLPTSDANGVQINGAPLTLQTGVLEIGEQGGRVLVRAISGTYAFLIK